MPDEARPTDAPPVLGSETVAETPTQADTARTGEFVADGAPGSNTKVLIGPATGQFVSLKTGAFDPSAAGQPATVLPTGSRIDAYEILDELGAGGMGVVYKARQIALNRIVALKMILAGGRAGATQLARFRAEALAVAQLDHANIIRIYDIGENDGLPFFAMEFIDGDTLEKITRRKPMEPLAAARLMETVARAIHFAHTRGVIHRDIKPANVMLTKDGQPKIADFGLAKQVDEEAGSKTEAGAILGTPNYMAPEQAEGNTRDVTPLADVYSLGATLYELLTGRPPFQGPTPINVINQVRFHEPVSPVRLQPGLSRDIETICLKCLQKEPTRRYSSAGDLADDLRRFIDGKPILARPIGPAEKLVRWCKRNPRQAALSFTSAGLAIAFVTALIAFNLVFFRQRNKIKEQYGDLQTAKSSVEQERDAVRRQSDLNAQQVRFLTRTLAAELKSLGLNRQREQVVKFVLGNIEKMERLSDEGAGITDRARLSALLQVAELYNELALADRSREKEFVAKSTDHLKRAVEWADKIVAENPQSELARANRALVLATYGTHCLVQGRVDEARKLLTDSSAIRQAIVDSPLPHTANEEIIRPADARSSLAEGHLRLAQLEDVVKNQAAAAQHERTAVALLEQAYAAVQNDASATHDGTGQMIKSELARAYIRVSGRAAAARNRADAEKFLAQALSLQEQALADSAESLTYKNELASTLFSVGVSRLIDKRYADARDTFDRMFVLADQALKQSDEATASPKRAMVARALYGLGYALHKLGDISKSVTAFRDCVRLRRQLLEEDDRPGNVWNLMVALARTGDHERAVKLVEDEKLRSRVPEEFWFNAACTYSIAADSVGRWAADDKLTPEQKKQREAYVAAGLDAIKAVFELKSRRAAGVETDPDLEYLQQRPEFTKLIADLKKRG